jgi:hypothetical protein
VAVRSPLCQENYLPFLIAPPLVPPGCFVNIVVVAPGFAALGTPPVRGAAMLGFAIPPWLAGFEPLPGWIAGLFGPPNFAIFNHPLY